MLPDAVIENMTGKIRSFLMTGWLDIVYIWVNVTTDAVLHQIRFWVSEVKGQCC